MKLKERIAIVTGAGSGLGKAIAHSMVAEGATVVVADIDPKGGRDTVEEILSKHNDGPEYAWFQEVDVSNEDSVKTMVKNVICKFGKIDILVNNAGMLYRKTLLEHSLEEWQKVISVDLTGVFLCTREVVPDMLKRNKGKIVNVASIAGQIGYPYPSYSAAKAGVINFSRSLVFDLAPKGINVNCICPGAILTPINESLAQDPVLYQRVLKKMPQKRLGRPEEIGKAAVFLASDDSDYINGVALTVDGGVTSFVTLVEEQ